MEEIKLIRKITDEDIGEIAKENNGKYRLRKSARGIILNTQGKIAILNKENKNEFKLPGGGVEEGENYEQAFVREALEETGCKVDILDFLGYTEEIKSHENFRQLSYCYVGKVVENTKSTGYTKKEIDEGAKILWLDIKEAYEKIKKSIGNIKGSKYDNLYRTKFIPVRDVVILEYYISKYIGK